MKNNKYSYLGLQDMRNWDKKMAIIRRLGSSLRIQSVFLDFLKHKSDKHIEYYSYFFVVNYWHYIFFNNF